MIVDDAENKERLNGQDVWEEACSICFEPPCLIPTGSSKVDNKTAVMTHVGQVYCKECLERWWQTSCGRDPNTNIVLPTGSYVLVRNKKHVESMRAIALQNAVHVRDELQDERKRPIPPRSKLQTRVWYKYLMKHMDTNKVVSTCECDGAVLRKVVGLGFNGVTIKRPMRNASLVDSTFVRCTFSHLSHSDLSNATFTECWFSGWMVDVKLNTNTTFERCRFGDYDPLTNPNGELTELQVRHALAARGVSSNMIDKCQIKTAYLFSSEV